MNPILPLVLALSFAGLAFRRGGWGVAWMVSALAATALLTPALAIPDGVPSPSATLARLAPWQGDDDGQMGHPELVDVTFQVEPWQLFLRRELRAARLPFWNPHQSSGAPYWSNGSSAPLFPLHLLYAALPLGAGMVLLPWLRLAIGGLGAWALARELGARPETALLAAVLFPLSGRPASFVLFPMGSAIALVPWVFLAVERLASGRGGWRGLAVAAGLQLLAGHPETPVLTALAAGVYLLVRGGDGDPGAEPGRGRWRWAPAAWGRFVAGWTVAGALSAVHNLPLAFTLFETTRWEAWQPPTPFPLPLLATLLLRLVLPDALGHVADGSFWGPLPFVPTTVYLGACALPLFAAALPASRGDRRVRGFAVVALAGLAGSYELPVARHLLLLVPLARHALHHYLLPAVVAAVAVLAARGLDALRDGRGRVLLAGAAVVVAGLGGGWIAFAGTWREHGAVAHQAAWTAGIVALVGVLLAALALPASRRRRLVLPLVALSAADLSLAHARSNPGLPLPRLFPETGAVRFLQGRPERVAAPGLVLRPNAAMVYGLFDVRGDDSLKLRWSEELYARELGSAHPTFFRPVMEWRSPWLDRLGVRWVMTDPGAPPLADGWRLAYDGTDARVFERPTAAPLVSLQGTDGGPVAGRVAIETRRPGRWEVRFEAPHGARLAVAETWDGGWRATVDGAGRPVLRVDGAILGVDVEGAGLLVLAYRPQGLGWGALLSAAGLGLILVRRRASGRRAPPPAAHAPGDSRATPSAPAAVGLPAP